jgi:hypothetical protein
MESEEKQSEGKEGRYGNQLRTRGKQGHVPAEEKKTYFQRKPILELISTNREKQF